MHNSEWINNNCGGEVIWGRRTKYCLRSGHSSGLSCSVPGGYEELLQSFYGQGLVQRLSLRQTLHLVSRLPSVYSDAILVVAPLHCRFVFGESLPQSPFCFTDVHMIAFSTGYFTFTRVSLILPLSPQITRIPSGRQTRSFLSVTPAMYGRNTGTTALGQVLPSLSCFWCLWWWVDLVASSSLLLHCDPNTCPAPAGSCSRIFTHPCTHHWYGHWQFTILHYYLNAIVIVSPIPTNIQFHTITDALSTMHAATFHQIIHTDHS